MAIRPAKKSAQLLPAKAAMGPKLIGFAEFPLLNPCGPPTLLLVPEEMQNLSPEEQQQLVKSLYTAASQGVGFMYARFPISSAENHSNEEVRFLHEFYKYINSKEMLDFVQEVSGRNDLLSADSQATSYTPGQYLTRHRDILPGEERRLAYVFGFSESWHPDWGGLLQFYEQNGNPRDAWSPAFNSLALFDVKHIHSVTYVAPFAAAQRLSLTGWFRAIPSKLGQEQHTPPI